uniref:Telomeric repeat-binding factor 2-interacting protein 1 n=1 Tax=Denticeps clupeoides TaxID=299321 RepID=A0AAY4ASC7_9TELE
MSKVTSAGLFQSSEGEPMRFYIRPSATKAQLHSLITTGGGMLCRTREAGVILLADPQENLTDTSGQIYVSTKYIWDCVEKNRRLDEVKYRLSTTQQIQTRATRRRIAGNGRMGYTIEEDQAILDFVSKHQKDVHGNCIWQDMEKAGVTGHSWQSMRDHYLKHLKHRRRVGRLNFELGQKSSSKAVQHKMTDIVLESQKHPEQGLSELRNQESEELTRLQVASVSVLEERCVLPPHRISDAPEQDLPPEIPEIPQPGVGPQQEPNPSVLAEKEPSSNKRARVDTVSDSPEIGQTFFIYKPIYLEKSFCIVFINISSMYSNLFKFAETGDQVALRVDHLPAGRTSTPVHIKMGILERAAKEFEDSQWVWKNCLYLEPQCIGHDLRAEDNQQPGPSNATPVTSKAHLFLFDNESQEDNSPSTEEECVSQETLEKEGECLILDLMRESNQSLEEVTKVLLKTSGDVTLALRCLLEGHNSGPLWTCSDDELLLSGDHHSISKLRQIYGEAGVSDRMAFLQIL